MKERCLCLCLPTLARKITTRNILIKTPTNSHRKYPFLFACFWLVFVYSVCRNNLNKTCRKAIFVFDFSRVTLISNKYQYFRTKVYTNTLETCLLLIKIEKNRTVSTDDTL